MLGFLSNFTHTMACRKCLNPKLLHCHESELSFIAILKWSVWNCVSTRYTEVQMLVSGNVVTHCRVIFGTTLLFFINKLIACQSLGKGRSQWKLGKCEIRGEVGRNYQQLLIWSFSGQEKYCRKKARLNPRFSPVSPIVPPLLEWLTFCQFNSTPSKTNLWSVYDV